MVKTYLTNRKIKFREIDVLENPKILKKILKNDECLSLPVITINNKLITDCSIVNVERVLNLPNSSQDERH